MRWEGAWPTLVGARLPRRVDAAYCEGSRMAMSRSEKRSRPRAEERAGEQYEGEDGCEDGIVSICAATGARVLCSEVQCVSSSGAPEASDRSPSARSEASTYPSPRPHPSPTPYQAQMMEGEDDEFRLRCIDHAPRTQLSASASLVTVGRGGKSLEVTSPRPTSRSIYPWRCTKTCKTQSDISSIKHLFYRHTTLQIVYAVANGWTNRQIHTRRFLPYRSLSCRFLSCRRAALSLSSSTTATACLEANCNDAESHSQSGPVPTVTL